MRLAGSLPGRRPCFKARAALVSRRGRALLPLFYGRRTSAHLRVVLGLPLVTLRRGGKDRTPIGGFLRFVAGFMTNPADTTFLKLGGFFYLDISVACSGRRTPCIVAAPEAFLL